MEQTEEISLPVPQRSLVTQRAGLPFFILNVFNDRLTGLETGFHVWFLNPPFPLS